MNKIFALFFMLMCSLVAAQNNKNEKINMLLIKTKSAEMSLNMMNYFLDRYEQKYTDIPADFWVQVKKEVKIDDLMKMIVPIYDKNFTEEEIDALLAFYDSPVGIKMIEKMPSILEESQQVGEKWGKGIAEKVIKKVQETSKLISPPPPSKPTK